MRRIFIILIGVIIGTNLWAAPRTPQEAKAIAGSFVQARAQTNGARRVSAKMDIAAASTAYYAINAGNGYVVVSADDRLPDVLGYSDNGTFDANNMSPAMRFWLACYDEELESMFKEAMTMVADDSRND